MAEEKKSGKWIILSAVLVALMIFGAMFISGQSIVASTMWSVYEAVTNLDMGGNNITNVSNIDADVITVDQLVAQNITVFGNLTNVTVINYNATGNFDVGGNLTVVGTTTSSWFAGFINYSYIQNWNWSEVYDNLYSYIAGDFQTNISSQVCSGTDKFSGYSNGVFTCDTDETGGGGGGDTIISGGTEGTRFYLFNSMKQDVVWNLTDADPSDYQFYAQENVIITPIGGKVI